MKAAALIPVSPAIGMIEYQQATSRYAELVAKAEEAAKQYHASVSDALTTIGDPVVPCPAIAAKADIPAPFEHALRSLVQDPRTLQSTAHIGVTQR